MDAEREIVDYINGKEIGATAYYDVPSTRPDRFVVAELSGGAESDIVVRTPLFDFQCWAKKRRDAAVLASDLRSALGDMPAEVPNGFHVNITSTYRDRDLDSGTPRYHVVAEIIFNE